MHALFDLDGTLTDSKEGITSCIKYALSKLDHPIPPMDDLEKWIGAPLHDSFVDLLGSIESADTALTLYRERFGSTGMYENRLYCGIEKSLKRLRDHVKSMYVVTSKATIYSEKIIDHFNLSKFFRKVYGSNLDGSFSKKSDLISFVLDAEALESSEAVMVGDRCHDLLGAKANGVRSVGVLWGYGSRQELEAAGADTLCEEPSCLHDCVVI